MPLSLEYSFAPSASPLLVSVAGGPANVVDLQITISNPSAKFITLKQIVIEIPVGEDSSRSLSSAANLPSPSWSTAGAWTIATTASYVTLTPATGDSAVVTPTGPLIFLLQAISVNTTAGTVPLTITETSVSGVKTKDANDYTLTKQVSNMPVTTFFATPSSVYDIEPVTLYWNCNDLGSNYSYAISCQGWTAQDCISNGSSNCLTPTDGTNGILTPPLTGNTTYTLQIIQVASSGNKVIVGTLTLTVPAFLPSIASQSAQKKVLGGCVVMLHWYTSNASSCSVQMDATVVATGLPTDTYSDGYPCYVTDSDAHTFAITAYGLSKSAASASLTFPQVSVTGPVTLHVGSSGTVGMGSAITPDNATALIPTATGLTLIDLTANPPAVEPASIPLDMEFTVDIAITPDGSQALVPTSTSLQFVDLATKAVTQTLPYPGLTSPYVSIAVSPDGAIALLPNVLQSSLYAVDIAKGTFLTVAAPLPGNPTISAVAITPDSSVAVLLEITGNIQFFDMATLALETTVIPFPSIDEPVIIGDIAISPDGLTALPYQGGNTVIAVIDIPSRSQRGTIAFGGMPSGISILPGNRLAAVIDVKSNVLRIVDLQTLTIAPVTVPLGAMPWSVSSSSDGTFTLVTDGQDGTVTIFQSDRNDAVF